MFLCDKASWSNGVAYPSTCWPSFRRKYIRPPFTTAKFGINNKKTLGKQTTVQMPILMLKDINVFLGLVVRRQKQCHTIHLMIPSRRPITNQTAKVSQLSWPATAKTADTGDRNDPNWRYEGFHKWGYPKNGRFIMENPIKWMIWGYPHSRILPITFNAIILDFNNNPIMIIGFKIPL